MFFTSACNTIYTVLLDNKLPSSTQNRLKMWTLRLQLYQAKNFIYPTNDFKFWSSSILVASDNQAFVLSPVNAQFVFLFPCIFRRCLKVQDVKWSQQCFCWQTLK